MWLGLGVSAKVMAKVKELGLGMGARPAAVPACALSSLSRRHP